MDAKAEVVDVFEFAEIADAANKIIETHERHTEDTGFRSHGLAIAYVEESESHDMVHVERIDSAVSRNSVVSLFSVSISSCCR